MRHISFTMHEKRTKSGGLANKLKVRMGLLSDGQTYNVAL